MTLKRKIIAWAVATILILPAYMVFVSEAIYINIIGMAYCWLMDKTCSHFLPAWMVEYFSADDEQEDYYN